MAFQSQFKPALGDSRGRRRPVRKPISTDESIAVFIRGHLLGGTEAELPATAPDLVYLALMPYLELKETKRWADYADAL